MIIKSLCDTDFYKFTMMQAVLHQYPSAHVRYAFKWRNEDLMKLRIDIKDFAARVKQEVQHLCDLQFHPDELTFLRTVPYFKPDFFEYLRLFQLNSKYIRVYTENDGLRITIEGPWVSTILFEVPVLAIVSQLYTENSDTTKAIWLPEARKRLDAKLQMLDNAIHPEQNFSFADFGTRRRADFEWQGEALSYTKERFGRFLAGTSNLYYAKELGLKPIGTMAHEWLQAHQQLGPRLFDFQKAALQTWADEYRGELGIALSDVVGFRAFLKDFDRYFALLFDGCRHDSGDPVWWAEGLIDHYKRLRIDPRTKTAVFSDGLSFEVAIDLFRRFHNQINVGYGIGTYFTNDCGFIAPQIVIKMVDCYGRPVSKVSDSAGKGMCEDGEFDHWLRRVIEDKINS
jgi:nicotinate phosphoribosyltransferase